MTDAHSDIFGGSRAWSPSDWTASDDRVRGGASQSYFECSSSEAEASFYGKLDIETLGGAGFASQRTVADDKVWDLSEYDGLRLEVTSATSTTFTLNLKDELLPPNPENGREQATISWEHDFVVGATEKDSSVLIEVPWSAFKPTYRGKAKQTDSKLDTANVRRFSFMVRSFFGDQKGSFELKIRSVSAYKGAVCRVGTRFAHTPYRDDATASPFEAQSDFEDEKRLAAYHARPRGGLLWILSCLCPEN